MLKDGILIIDFGSQYNQLIARRVRENHVYCKIVPPSITLDQIKEINPKGIILSGGPCSVYHGKAPSCDVKLFDLGIPILGICYGMQLMTKLLGGKVQQTHKREYGRAALKIKDSTDLFKSIPSKIVSWMSHGDYVSTIPKDFKTIASTKNTKFAAVANKKKKAYGVQFHPEVVHTEKGTKIISNFLFEVCKCKRTWTMKNYVKNCVKEFKDKIGKDNVVLGLSGGVDSSVAAVLVQKAIGKQLHCIFVDNGLLRKNERQGVEKLFKKNMNMNLTVVDASKQFISKLKGVTDPEKKRKIIGNLFVKVFEKEAKRIGNVKFLGQGTLYPDVIESESAFGGPTAVIKSHHNVGGLPKKMGLKLVEPLRELFKDEVRALGKEMGMQKEVLMRQPFPGPGLGIRVLGEVTKEKLDILKDADDIYISEIKAANLYYKIWQAFAVILPVKTVGVMGDERTYENVLALRAVTSRDGMTADWAQIPYDVLGKISNRIINEVKGINRVVYDISSKPPGTIEWE